MATNVEVTFKTKSMYIVPFKCVKNRLNAKCCSNAVICFSLGMSWLSPRLGKRQSESPLMFECLKALTIGLGNGVCEQIFTCETNIIRTNKQTN